MAVDLALWLLVGLPGSGKSTWASLFTATNPDVRLTSTDAIRARLYGNEAIQGHWGQIWHQMQQEWQVAMQQGARNVIYDATNVRRRYRREAIAAARQLGFTRIVACWFDVPLAVCLERNHQRKRQVPEAVIHTMQRQLIGAPPSLSEGFDAIFRLTTVR